MFFNISLIRLLVGSSSSSSTLLEDTSSRYAIVLGAFASTLVTVLEEVSVLLDTSGDDVDDKGFVALDESFEVSALVTSMKNKINQKQCEW